MQPKVGFGTKNNAKSQGYAVQPKVGFGTKNNAKSQGYAVQSKVVLISRDASAANPVHATDAPDATTAAASTIPLLRARDAAVAPSNVNAHAENVEPIDAKDAPGSSALPLLQARYRCCVRAAPLLHLTLMLAPKALTPLPRLAGTQ